MLGEETRASLKRTKDLKKTLQATLAAISSELYGAANEPLMEEGAAVVAADVAAGWLASKAGLSIKGLGSCPKN